MQALCDAFPVSDETVQLTEDLKKRAVRATLLARQLVPLGDEEEVSYCEEELGLLLMQEVRDLPPAYDQLTNRPDKASPEYLWHCKQAGEVHFCFLEAPMPASACELNPV